MKQQTLLQRRQRQASSICGYALSSPSISACESATSGRSLEMRPPAPGAVGDQIGEGNFGVVFACTDVWENRVVAKILKPRQDSTDGLETHALEEMQKFLHVRHPNVTHIYDAFEFITDIKVGSRSNSAGGARPLENAFFGIVIIGLFRAVHDLNVLPLTPF
jgi:hypothetical protein